MSLPPSPQIHLLFDIILVLSAIFKEEILDLYHRNNIYRIHLDSKNIEVK